MKRPNLKFLLKILCNKMIVCIIHIVLSFGCTKLRIKWLVLQCHLVFCHLITRNCKMLLYLFHQFSCWHCFNVHSFVSTKSRHSIPVRRVWRIPHGIHVQFAYTLYAHFITFVDTFFYSSAIETLEYI